MHRLSCGHVVSEPGQTHYCSYLRLQEMLSLQPAPEELRHPDEHLFVITHQAFELWFAQLRFDLERIVVALRDDDVPLATWLVRRCVAILKLFSPMMRVLETMSPSDFFAFREHLAPASGTESSQWHEVELLAGLRDEGFRRFLEAEPSGDPERGVPSKLWTDRLEELWNRPSVASELRRLFERRGVGPADIYVVAPEKNPHGDLMLLAEALLDFDEEFRIWRFAHARTAQREIGPDTEGTGHTSGVSYLDRVATGRADFFPELWRAREELWERRRG
ncbi:tryptophan 2,3-dioxygenase family protein [Rubrobacter taiwanensis]|nr:tryptophan 2,3-dioxygenase family protein [Rubrobacter taiwanensis]